MNNSLLDSYRDLTFGIYSKYSKKYLSRLLNIKKSDVIVPRLDISTERNNRPDRITGKGGISAELNVFKIIDTDDAYPAISIYLHNVYDSIDDMDHYLVNERVYVNTHIMQTLLHELTHYSLIYGQIADGAGFKQLSKFSNKEKPDAIEEELYCDDMAYSFMKELDDDPQYQRSISLNILLREAYNMILWETKSQKKIDAHLNRLIKAINKYIENNVRESLGLHFAMKHKTTKKDGSHRSPGNRIILEPLVRD